MIIIINNPSFIRTTKNKWSVNSLCPVVAHSYLWGWKRQIIFTVYQKMKIINAFIFHWLEYIYYTWIFSVILNEPSPRYYIFEIYIYICLYILFSPFHYHTHTQMSFLSSFFVSNFSHLNDGRRKGKAQDNKELWLWRTIILLSSSEGKQKNVPDFKIQVSLCHPTFVSPNVTTVHSKPRNKFWVWLLFLYHIVLKIMSIGEEGGHEDVYFFKILLFSL